MLDRLDGDLRAAVTVEREDGHQEPMWAAELLRELGLPRAERAALDAARGRVLDVGAGAGAHALLLAEAGHEVTALELSPNLVTAMRRRGVERVVLGDVFAPGDTAALGRFDTLLFLMNGLGLAGELRRLPALLDACRPLLARGGAVLTDGCDLRRTAERGERALAAARRKAGRYFGDTRFHFAYQGRRSARLGWLYVDATTLRRTARAAGWATQLLYQDGAGIYLARLTPTS